ncbi:MAG: YjbE family putative metal transport protein [Sphingomonas sp.]|uniref:YjbE family putative metal transport protein n=1 Tax=Sphingomonas sp. TaxID=28214 RepID=UPI001AC31B7E|nr:YjbE family putative metal transport protein [Sphingomonas sp.]MBN8809048.1 YjbE family putative metal transport protein [Sphingomonas sp.]
MADFSFADVFTAGGLAALGQVILIDLTLASDNVLVLGTLASGLPADQRKRVLMIGVGVALVFLVGFALIATQLLQLVGLLFAGGLLLAWVAFKLALELWSSHRHAEAADTVKPAKTFGRAALQIAAADLSMSLDNVLAVAGTARNHPAVLLFGLALSVTLMAVAANFMARVIERYRWIAYIGVVVLCYVAGNMIYHGLTDQAVGVIPAVQNVT